MSKYTTQAVKAINGTTFWAKLTRPNQDGKYSVDICNLSDKAVEFLKQYGANVRTKGDERGNFISCSSKYPITPYTVEGDEIESLIGNGSQAQAVIEIRTGTNQYGPQCFTSIKKLRITDLIEYAGAGDETEAVSFDDAL